MTFITTHPSEFVVKNNNRTYWVPFLKALLGARGLKSVPEVRNIECGGTGYLHAPDTWTFDGPLAGGVDEYGREFLLLRLTDGEQVWTEILFQRYASASSVVVPGEESGEGRSVITQTALNEIDGQFIAKLIQGGPVKALQYLRYDHELKETYYAYCGKQVWLCE
tara:strand:- start:205 stop:699 length:495 start_codon:yes stop_codon:yes gene_type:complete